ncbi:MAG: DUF2141 domain-containing protein [Bacteroidales bacterium]|nr:DUF2141 domain-containing protein [Bacteroidales bacterium]
MATVTIIITNSSKAQGTVNAFLWDNAEKFPKSKKEHFGMRTAIAGTDSLQLIFNEVPFGKYAISVFCDENENKEFDRSLLRGTSEPFALSGQPDYNNPPIKFNDCSFMVDSGFHCIHLKLLFQKDLDNIRDSIQKMDGK